MGSNPFSTAAGGNTSSNPFAAAGLSTSELAAKPPQVPSPSPEPTSSETPKDTLPKTFASALSLNNPQSQPSSSTPPPQEPWPTTSLPTSYPLFYLVDADYEPSIKNLCLHPLKPQSSTILPTHHPAEKKIKKSSKSTHDTTFQKFADRLSQNPEQVIRYEFRGSPLLYSKTDSVGKFLRMPGMGMRKLELVVGVKTGRYRDVRIVELREFLKCR
ncbi:hypothetical protein DID88_002439 [Monilinia fructigena]|uniref:Programmed cell death protein 2 C-terminal domain-containing protein n=1 Tax=Monilinia fructigena TaxID=38457 RepID=A0A395INT7_9HELO|nr:hypothetical protein DID88_002439 [Monilinia fructigena]